MVIIKKAYLKIKAYHESKIYDKDFSDWENIPYIRLKKNQIETNSRKFMNADWKIKKIYREINKQHSIFLDNENQYAQHISNSKDSITNIEDKIQVKKTELERIKTLIKKFNDGNQLDGGENIQILITKKNNIENAIDSMKKERDNIDDKQIKISYEKEKRKIIDELRRLYVKFSKRIDSTFRKTERKDVLINEEVAYYISMFFKYRRKRFKGTNEVITLNSLSRAKREDFFVDERTIIEDFNEKANIKYEL